MGVVPRKAFIIVRKSRKVLQKLCTCTPFATLPQLPLPLPLYLPLPLPAVYVCVCKCPKYVCIPRLDKLMRYARNRPVKLSPARR